MTRPTPHTDDAFHVILDALVSHETGISGGEEPWTHYDEGVSPMGDQHGYGTSLRSAVTLITEALNKGRTAEVYDLLGITRPDADLTYPTIEISDDAKESYDPLLSLLGEWVATGTCVNLHLHNGDEFACMFVEWVDAEQVKVREWSTMNQDYNGPCRIVRLGHIDKIVYR